MARTGGVYGVTFVVAFIGTAYVVSPDRRAKPDPVDESLAAKGEADILSLREEIVQVTRERDGLLRELKVATANPPIYFYQEVELSALDPRRVFLNQTTEKIRALNPFFYDVDKLDTAERALENAPARISALSEEHEAALKSQAAAYDSQVESLLESLANLQQDRERFAGEGQKESAPRSTAQRDVPRPDKSARLVRVISEDGSPVVNASVVAVSDLGIPVMASTGSDGSAHLVTLAHRSYDLLIAHPEYPGRVVEGADLRTDFDVTLEARGKNRSIAFVSIGGSLPGMSGQLQIGEQTPGKYYLYAHRPTMGINDGVKQPATILRGTAVTLEDEHGMKSTIWIHYVREAVSLVEFTTPKRNSG